MHIVMLGDLHTEMAIWNTVEDILNGFDLVATLTEPGVASAEAADFFLNWQTFSERSMRIK